MQWWKRIFVTSEPFIAMCGVSLCRSSWSILAEKLFLIYFLGNKHVQGGCTENWVVSFFTKFLSELYRYKKLAWKRSVQEPVFDTAEKENTFFFFVLFCSTAA